MRPTNIIESNVYKVFNSYSKYIAFWLVFFTFITLINLLYDLNQCNNGNNKNNKNNENKKNKITFDKKTSNEKENVILEELPGITFILLHTLCFFTGKTLCSKILYLYWGPLFFVTAYFVLFEKNIDWKLIALPSSVLCKSFYVIFVSIFWYLGYMMPIYCYSLWIMSDQIRLAWWKNNADRSRRLFEDYFFPRIGYPLFLLLPFFDKTFCHRELFMGVSSVALLVWILGIYRLVKNNAFFIKPKVEGFGRDIVYL